MLMAYSSTFREEVTLLRRSGYSLQEIHQLKGVSKSTLSMWLQNVQYSPEGLLRKFRIKEKAQRNYQKYIRLKREQQWQIAIKEAEILLNTSPIESRILTTLWWCEGTKMLKNGIKFTNADPTTIKFFIRLLDKVVKIDHKRIRLQLHLHTYHVQDQQIKFWSEITSIPKDQFRKPHIKVTSNKRKKEGYEGCMTIEYGDSKKARVLKAMWDIISMST